MNFEDILNQWEEDTSKAYGKKRMIHDSNTLKENTSKSININTKKIADEEKRAHPIDIWMRQNGVQDKDNDLLEEIEQSPAQKRKKLRALKPEAIIDLHGLTREESWIRLSSFFTDCTRKNVRKVLIIHGKGTHSEDGSVLRQMVARFLEQHPHAGESGIAQKDSGGSGATWVLLK